MHYRMCNNCYKPFIVPDVPDKEYKRNFDKKGLAIPIFCPFCDSNNTYVIKYHQYLGEIKHKYAILKVKLVKL